MVAKTSGLEPAKPDRNPRGVAVPTLEHIAQLGHDLGQRYLELDTAMDEAFNASEDLAIAKQSLADGTADFIEQCELAGRSLGSNETQRKAVINTELAAYVGAVREAEAASKAATHNLNRVKERVEALRIKTRTFEMLTGVGPFSRH